MSFEERISEVKIINARGEPREPYEVIRDAKLIAKRADNALEHIARVASNGTSQTRRDRWIAQRAQSALDNDEKWKEEATPKMVSSTLKRQKYRIAEMKELLEDFMEVTSSFRNADEELQKVWDDCDEFLWSSNDK